MGASGSLETFAEETESLRFKFEFSLENVAVVVSKYIFLVLGSQRQIEDIGRLETFAKEKKRLSFKVDSSLEKNRRCGFKIHCSGFGITGGDWGHWAVWRHMQKKKNV